MPDDNNGSKPATKADLAALENRLTEVVRDAQREILRAFERYASSE
ncbi:MAG: hypothetical protein ABSH49_04115 [Bryobacteraceae bacterium]|jgi:hypothetical protein